MTTQEIREKLTKAQEVVTKKEAWLVKLNAKAEQIVKIRNAYIAQIVDEIEAVKAMMQEVEK